MIIVVWIVLLTIFVGSYVMYLGYLKSKTSKPWGLILDQTFKPSVTILVPAHDEAGVIRKKLENLLNVSYPKQKMEVIVIDDDSKDSTIAEVYGFASNHPDFPLRVVRQNPRKGKAYALNKGLREASHDIIVVTDADAFWSQDILCKALPYLSDPTVGAISGRQVAGSSVSSWVAKGERDYLDFMTMFRLGESKIHSTIRFEGIFCAFKKISFDKFDCELGADDSGTALQIIQNNYRTIFIPELAVPSEVPHLFKERVKVKIRRAVHLTGLWVQCLKLFLRRQLVMPKRIAVPEIFISLCDPLIFVALVGTTLILVALNPVLLIGAALGFGCASLFRRTRFYLISAILDQFIMFYSIVLYASNKKITTWNKT